MTSCNGRSADYRIEPLFLERWSPRSFSGETISDTDLFTIFEAARWAPSSSNLQPWRFLYAKRDTPDWSLLFEPIKPGNQTWAQHAAALLTILSKRDAPAKGSDVVRENYFHSFDTGAAWACLALQASRLGWVAHAIGGFEIEKATANLGVPEEYRIECMVAIGRYKGTVDAASANSRSPQTSFVRAGAFLSA